MPQPITDTQELLRLIAQDPDFIHRDNGLILIPTEDYLAIYHPVPGSRQDPPPAAGGREGGPHAPAFRPGYEKPRRGGRRPGAGAPLGNLNGLKKGQYSPRFQAAALLRSS